MYKSNKLIGVCGANLFEQNSIQFLSSLREVSFQRGYTTIAFSACVDSPEDVENPIAEKELLDLCMNIDLDCIIMLTETLKNPHLIRSIVDIGNKKNIPVFSIDGIVDGCYNMPLDYRTAFKNMVNHVLDEHGVTRVNMLAGMRDNPFSDERVDMYKEALAEHGIPFENERLGYGDFWARPARVAMQKFLDSKLPMPQAIICANDEMAITACSVLSEHGYKIPEDIIVTGFDGTQSSVHHYPTITTCTPDYEESIDFIIEQSEQVKNTGKLSPCVHKVNFLITKRQSCGCVPNTIHDNSRLVSSLYAAVGDASWHTIAMNALVTRVLEKSRLEDIIELLPETVHLWSDHFRFACVKSELTEAEINLDHCRDSSGKFERMTTILHVKDGKFDESHETFDVTEFIPHFDELIERPGTTFVARILKNGKQVYGYTVDEFDILEHRQLQRCNEFAMFLTHSINTVLHNYELTELNRNLEKANADIASLSIHDPMTGIYNRRGFFKTLATCLSDEKLLGKYLYVVNVDLDGLKYINDNYGHKEGDFAITTVAHSLNAIRGDHLICARFGGDEFTCTFIADRPYLYNTEQLKAEITNAMFMIPDVTRKEYPLGFSIGLCVQVITPFLNIENVISAADEKMYADKAARKRMKQS